MFLTEEIHCLPVLAGNGHIIYTTPMCKRKYYLLFKARHTHTQPAEVQITLQYTDTGSKTSMSSRLSLIEVKRVSLMSWLDYISCDGKKIFLSQMMFYFSSWQTGQTCTNTPWDETPAPTCTQVEKHTQQRGETDNDQNRQCFQGPELSHLQKKEFQNQQNKLTWRKAAVQGIVQVNTSQSSNESYMIVEDTWKCVTSTTKKLWYSNGKQMVVWYIYQSTARHTNYG